MTINIPTLVSQTITNGVTAYAPSEDAVFDSIATRLTKSSGDTLYQPLDADLTAIAALATTSGIPFKTAANTWAMSTAVVVDAAETQVEILLNGGAVSVFGNASGGTFYNAGQEIYSAPNDFVLAATTNNLSVGQYTAINISLTGSQSLTGIITSSNQEGAILYIANIDNTDVLTLVDASTSSTTTNRFGFYPAGNITVNPKEVIQLVYNASRWRYVGKLSTGTGDALTTNPLSQFAATTSAQLAGVISDETGTDKLVFNTSPTFATQTLTTAITATTNATDTLETLTNNSSGTPAASYGLNRLIQLKSSTTDSQTAGKENWYWTTATHASRQSAYSIQLVGNASVGTLQDAFRIKNNGNSFQFDLVNHSGYDPKLAFYSGTTLVADVQTAGNDFYFSTVNSSAATIYFRPGSSSTMIRLNTTGMFLGGSTAPTATLHLKAGTTAASSAPIKLVAGTNMTTPENGAIEFDGTNIFITVGGVRKTFTII